MGWPDQAPRCGGGARERCRPTWDTRPTLSYAPHDRRARTRHLIELGGLVQKAGLVDLMDDDRATLLGAFLELTARLRGQREERREESPADLLARWRRRGLRAFETDRNVTPTRDSEREEEQPKAETR